MNPLSVQWISGLITLWVFYSPTVTSTETVAAEVLVDEYQRCYKTRQAAERLNCYDSILSLFKEEVGPDASLSDDPIDVELAEAKQRIEAIHSSESIGKLSSNDPNYFVWAEPTGNDLADDRHIEFYISQKYPLVEDWFSNRKYEENEAGKLTAISGRSWIPDRLYFIYNGLYDFYALGDGDRYNSSPIISRKQNPGASLEWDLQDPSKKVRLSWFHESNGQTLEENKTDSNGDILELKSGELSNQQVYERRQSNRGDDFALAGVSRGWDYASIRYEDSRYDTIADYSKNWYQWHLEYRWFCDCQGFTGDREDAIWWDENNDDKIEDYDGLRFMGEKAFSILGGHLLGRIEYKSGTSSLDALSNASWKVTIGPRLKNVRLTAFYFNGYGKEPSTYHLRTEYWGAGLEFR